MKLQTKIIVLFNLICWALIAGFAIYISYFTRDSLRTKFFHRLEENAQIVGKHTIEEAEHINEIYYEIMRTYLRQLSAGKDYIIRVDKQFSDVAVKPDLPLPPDFYQDVITQGKAQYMDLDTAYLALYFSDPDADKNLIVISSGRDDYGLGEQVSLDRTLLNAAGVCMLIVALISFLFARHIIKPIASINHEINKISIANLNLRIANSHKVHDEISTLIESFNQMIARLEVSVNSQKSFVANASHSFRTPLTIIKGEAELAVQVPGLNKESTQSLLRIINETDQIITMINNLLIIARSGLEDSKKDYTTVRLDEVLFRVLSSESKASGHPSIYLDLAATPEIGEMLEVFGNENLLFIALSNIVSNACKYGKDAQVTISLRSQEDDFVIDIKDQGVGIPSSEKDFVYDSFFRASNVRSIQGTGLGLLLAKNIIDLHDGNLLIHSIEGEGTHVTVILPKRTSL
ncbi:HAMP domain-containing sensor histidine kinase [Sphingobacterium corticibacter]|uniref:histidine kinase n=1 Tax=Sphingobacterium corticibacter TaxID=2171749 RepID=A0A2T8HMC4_9SPHI|nr:HAMP domain-containing sensor histidine kinase [Sphingobacterium corticibacter]PVH26599.1 sensor histidine kinase [Sphingobacterium corticibacter]